MPKRPKNYIFLQKRQKNAKKWRKRYFWQAKSAVERPFGHLTFRIFVKTVFFLFILIDFVKKRVFGFFGIICMYLARTTKSTLNCFNNSSCFKVASFLFPLLNVIYMYDIKMSMIPCLMRWGLINKEFN